MLSGRWSFSGHETFPFRFAWLKKAVDAVAEQPRCFGREDAMVRLGVGKNMVASMRHWALACGMVEEDDTVDNNRGRALRVSYLGSKLFADEGWDPYLEDPATPWLLHWRIASDPSYATTWFWVFNHMSQLEFTKGELERGLQELVRSQPGTRVTEASLKRDIDCFLRTYVASRGGRSGPLEESLDCPLVDLGLIHEAEHRGSFARVRGVQPSLPAEIFTYCLVQFLEKREGKAKTLALDALAFEPGSPGRVFSLSEEGLLSRLEKVEAITKGRMSFDETAGLRQLLVKGGVDASLLLNDYYKRRKPRGEGARA